jgi:hypothetical protein
MLPALIWLNPTNEGAATLSPALVVKSDQFVLVSAESC